MSKVNPSSSQFLPTETTTGASRAGNSYINLFAKCPRKWFNGYYRPTTTLVGDRLDEDKQARGIQPELTAPPLLKGRLFHEGLAAWYLSGVRYGADTGERDIDQALAVLDEQAKDARREYPDEETAETDRLDIQTMLLEYHDWYGPGGRLCDWPDHVVAVDGNGEALVERDWVTDLGHRGYIYTCRSDLLFYDRGYLKTMEHKTSSAYYVKQMLGSLPMNPQFSGEFWVMQQLFPDTHLNGVMVNVVVKNRSARSKYNVAVRETTTRTPEQLERWRLDTITQLERIDASVERFERLLEEGRTVEEAADVAFPITGGRTGECSAYNRPCEFTELCRLPGRESSVLKAFRPRTVEERTRLREW